MAWLDVGRLSNLRRLSITTFDNPLLSQWLLRLLAGVPKINNVQELTITVIFSDFAEATWGEIDAILAEPKFAPLGVISLRYWKKEHETLLPEEKFPLLVSKGILLVFNEGDCVFPRNDSGFLTRGTLDPSCHRPQA